MIIALADKLFSVLARRSRADSSGYVNCICCGEKVHWMMVDPAHYVGRANMCLRWELDNVWPCHRTCHEREDHLKKYRDGLIEKMGIEFVERLERRGREYCKAPSEQDVFILCDQFTERIKAIANQAGSGSGV